MRSEELDIIATDGPVSSDLLLGIYSQLECLHEFPGNYLHLVTGDASDPPIHVQCLLPCQVIKQGVKLRTVAHQFASLNTHVQSLHIWLNHFAINVGNVIFGQRFLIELLN